jgi:hypothetical protein
VHIHKGAARLRCEADATGDVTSGDQDEGQDAAAHDDVRAFSSRFASRCVSHLHQKAALVLPVTPARFPAHVRLANLARFLPHVDTRHQHSTKLLRAPGARAGGADVHAESIGARPLGKLTGDQQEVVLMKRRLVVSERGRVELAHTLAAERRAAALTQATLSKSEQAVRGLRAVLALARAASCAAW